MLESGLPEVVCDEATLARFLTQSNQFKKLGETLIAKPDGYLPYPKYKNTSVFHMVLKMDDLVQIWDENNTGGRNIKAVAFVTAGDVRQAQLDVGSEEPPPRHANIESWPWNATDPKEQKAAHLELATIIASKATVRLVVV